MKKTKITYLILGLGIGLVLSNILHTTFPPVEYIDLSDQAIIQRAKELGYVSIKEKISNKKEKTNQKQDKNDQEEADKIDKSKDDRANTHKDYIELEIVEGDNLDDIANKLLEAGLIEDKGGFVSTVEAKDMDKRFAYGRFQIPIDSNYSKIIELLTR